MAECRDDLALAMINDKGSVFRAMVSSDTRDHDRMIRLFVRGLRGTCVSNYSATHFTGSYEQCRLCSATILGILLAEHVMTACPWRREPKEIVVAVAGNGEPEPHWEKD